MTRDHPSDEAAEKIEITDPSMQAVARAFEDDPSRAAKMANDLHEVGQSAGWGRNEWLLATTVYQEAALRSSWVDEEEESLRWLELAVEAAEGAQSAGDGARSLLRLGDQAFDLHDLARAHEAFEQAAELAKEAGLPRVLARSLGRQGVIHFHRRDYDLARRFLEEALHLFEQHEDKEALASVIASLGKVEGAARSMVAARRHLERAVALFAELGDRQPQAMALCDIGEILTEMGELDDAEAPLREALALFDKLWDRPNEGRAFQRLGALELARGHEEAATEHLYDALNAHAVSNDLWGLGEDLSRMGAAYAHFGHPELAAAAFECALILHNELGAARELIDDFRQQAAALLRVERQTPMALANLRQAQLVVSGLEKDERGLDELMSELDRRFEEASTRDVETATSIEGADEAALGELRAEGLKELLSSASVAAIHYSLRMIVAETMGDLDQFLHALAGQSRALASVEDLRGATAALILVEEAVDELGEGDDDAVAGWRDVLASFIAEHGDGVTLESLRLTIGGDAERLRAEAIERLRRDAVRTGA